MAELPGHHGFWRRGDDLFGLLNRAPNALLARSEHKFSPEKLHEFPSLDRKAVRHSQDASIASSGAGERKPDTCVAGGRLHDDAAGTERPIGLHGFDHGDRDSILYARQRIKKLKFGEDLRLATGAMRAALPASVPLADAVANLGAVAVGVAGLATGRYELLRRLTVDRLHEPYRAAVYPQLPAMVEAARSAGALGACLSGAGSTIIAFTDSIAGVVPIEAAFGAAAADADLPGRTMVVALRNIGAWIVARD